MGVAVCAPAGDTSAMSADPEANRIAAPAVRARRIALMMSSLAFHPQTATTGGAGIEVDLPRPKVLRFCCFGVR
jgi:hypothetical protein